MPSGKHLDEAHVRETYRYLRIGLIGASALLAISILFERSLVDCWQESLSAYYYTPARGVFVGTLVAVGLVLIVIKGRGWEDFFLNLAGMLAPVVAFVPTTSVGTCWSIEPNPSPLATAADGTPAMAGWVVANVDNNMWALIIAGALGLALAVALYVRSGGTFFWPFEVGKGNLATAWGMLLVTLIIGGSAVALWRWDGFYTEAHDIAAIGMFIFLASASAVNAVRTGSTVYRSTYWAITILMVATVPVVLWVSALVPGWSHYVLWMEIIEITLFTAYWITQTIENWEERVAQ